MASFRISFYLDVGFHYPKENFKIITLVIKIVKQVHFTLNSKLKIYNFYEKIMNFREKLFSS